MNPTKILFSILALIFTLNIINAIYLEYVPVNIDFCSIYGICDTAPEITVSLEQDTYYVQSDKTLDLYFVIKNTGNKTGNVIIQMQPDEDDEDYFTAERVSKDIEILPNTEERVKYRIYIEDNSDFDKYRLPFKIIEYYYKNDKYIQDSYSLYANIYVEEFDLVDVYLENNKICVNYDAPYYTNLVFANNSNRTYYISPKVKSNLMISVKSDLIEIKKDREVKVELKINKELPIGEYDILIKQDIYKDKVYSNPKYLEKTLTLEVVNCAEENLYVNVPTKTITMDSEDTKQVGFNLSNRTGEDMPVYLSYKTSDPSLTVSFPSQYINLNNGENYSNSFKIITSETSSGFKTITIIVETPYTTIEKDVIVSVTKNNLEVFAKHIDIPLGLTGIQEITLTNNSNNTMNLYLAIKQNYTDVLNIKTSHITLKSGQSKTIEIEITPKTIGNKEYKFVIAGSMNKEFTMNYASNSEISNTNFVSNYNTKTNPKVNSWNNLKVTLYNPHNLTTTVTLRVLGNDIETKTLNIQLNPNQTRTVDLGYMPGANASKANLEVSSNLGSNVYPINMSLIYDTENPKTLEIKEVPTTIGYLKNKTTKKTFKVYNPNNFSVNGTLKIIDNDNSVIAEETFSIGPNTEKEVETEYKLNNNTSGIVKLIAGNSAKDYDVVFAEKTGFFETGLFGLGFGNTLSMIFGAIIIVGLVAYFIVRRN